MILKLINGVLESHFVLFNDQAERKGSRIFHAILKAILSSSSRQVHVFCWDAGTALFLRNCNINFQNMYIYDCFSDPKGWIHSDNDIRSIHDKLMKAQAENSDNTCLIIDSLSNMMFALGFGTCIRELQNLSTSLQNNGVCTEANVRQLLCMMHSDVLPGGSGTFSLLRHMASTFVELQGEVALTTHRKLGGHVERKEELITISPSFELRVQQVVSPHKSAPVHCGTSLLPQDVASFRVNLNEKEREEKGRLVLPYMRTSDHIGSGGGRVYYQPDAVDDWDDEDPDDDLDI